MQKRIDLAVTNGLDRADEWGRRFQPHVSGSVNGTYLQEHLACMEGYDVRKPELQAEIAEIGGFKEGAFIPFNFNALLSDRQATFGKVHDPLARLGLAQYHGLAASLIPFAIDAVRYFQ
jgi:hypothetical protein